MSPPATTRTAPACVQCDASANSLPLISKSPGVVMSITPSASSTGVKLRKFPRLTALPALRPSITMLPLTVTARTEPVPLPAMICTPSWAWISPSICTLPVSERSNCPVKMPVTWLADMPGPDASMASTKVVDGAANVRRPVSTRPLGPTAKPWLSMNSKLPPSTPFSAPRRPCNRPSICTLPSRTTLTSQLAPVGTTILTVSPVPIWNSEKLLNALPSRNVAVVMTFVPLWD